MPFTIKAFQKALKHTKIIENVVTQQTMQALSVQQGKFYE